MLPYITYGERGPRIILLHWLGGSARTWEPMSLQLAQAGMRCTALDLPGFGAAASFHPFTLEHAVSEIIDTIRTLRAHDAEAPWLLAGHSMGSKFAQLVAHAATKSEVGLEQLSGLILISPSTLSPEPMSESKRQQLMDTLGNNATQTAEQQRFAQEFLEDNTGKPPLLPSIKQSAMEDLLRMNRDAFSAWFEQGSKEDWSTRIDALSVPALVLAGTDEKDLGHDAQRKWTMPHLPAGTLRDLEGAGHLSPLERPSELADRIVAFAQHLNLAVAEEPPRLSQTFRNLLDSPRTSPQTRSVMQSRLVVNPSPVTALTADQCLTLRAMVRRIAPGAGFDLAAHMLQWLAAEQHDGWRFDDLPADAEAWQKGLHSLDKAAHREHGVFFSALHPKLQDELLTLACDGEMGRGVWALLGFGKKDATLTAAQMKLWLQEVRGEVAKLYIAHPLTMQRIGFDGFADEGGFTKITLTVPEARS